MSIKLIYGPTEKYPASQVTTEDQSLEPVAGFIQVELDAPYKAREFLREAREVIAGKREPRGGAGNAYYFRVGPENSEIGLDISEPAKTISVPTKDLLEAVEEWAAHLEKSRAWPEWALKGPGAK